MPSKIEKIEAHISELTPALDIGTTRSKFFKERIRIKSKMATIDILYLSSNDLVILGFQTNCPGNSLNSSCNLFCLIIDHILAANSLHINNIYFDIFDSTHRKDLNKKILRVISKRYTVRSVGVIEKIVLHLTLKISFGRMLNRWYSI